MADRGELLADLRERALFYSSLTRLGVPAAPFTRANGGAAEEGGDSALAEAPHGLAVASTAAAGRELESIREWIGDCQRCKLAPGRKTIVFGQGHPRARLVFVGEAPGAEEDEQGLAFVGKAGQLLTRIIEAIGLRREDVWIGNILKCRPPGNRNPEPDEVLSCQPFLERQIEAIRPKVIVGLGKFAAQFLLKTAEPITRLRGRLGQYQGITVMPTYHPAYLLRNPAAKKQVWEDMKVVKKLLAD